MTDSLATNAQESSFRPLSLGTWSVTFPVTSIQTKGGHRLALHEAYKRPGADVEACGREPYTFTVAVPLVNDPGLVTRYGTLFPDLMNAVIAAIESNPVLTFTHPIEGTLNVGVKSWSRTDDPDHRAGPVLTIELVEHNATLAILRALDGSTPTDSTSAAPLQAKAADSAASTAKLPTADTQTLGAYWLAFNVFTEALAFLALGTITFAQIQATLAAMRAPVTWNLALVAAQPFNAATAANVHALVVALETLQATVYQLQSVYLPGLGQTRYYTTPRVMADWEVAQAMYGDISAAGGIRAANALSNYSAIPMGTVLTILPLPS